MADMNVALVLRLVDQLTGPLNKAKSKLNGFRESISNGARQGFKDSGVGRLFDPVKLEENLKLNEKRIQQTRSRLMGAFGQALTLAAPVKLAADFDQSFKSVEKVVDAPKKRLAELRKFALTTSMQVPVAARDLLELMAEAAQGGVPTEDLERFTAFTSRMAVAADMAGGEIGERFAKIRNVYKLNQEGIEALGDSANHLSNNMAAKAREIFDFTNRASGGAAMLKLNAVQMNAIAASLVASGIVPETAARGFNVFANKLVSGGKTVEKAFKSVGLSREQVLADVRDRGAVAFAEFIERLASKGDKGARALSDIVGVDFSDDFGKLLANPDIIREALGLISDPANYKGSALEEAAKQSEGAAQQFAKLKNQLTAAAIFIGEQLLPPILEVTESIGNLVVKMTEWAQANPETFSMLVKLAAGALALSIALKVLAFGWAITGGALLRGGFAIAKLIRGVAFLSRALTLASAKPAVFARALRTIPALRWALLIPKLSWLPFVPKFAWRAFLSPLKWLSLVPKLSWRALIPLLRWGVRFIPVIGWAALAGELAWHLLIKPLGWDKYLNMESFRRLTAEIKSTLDGLVDKLRNWLGMAPQMRPGDDGYVEQAEGAAGRRARRGRTSAAVEGAVAGSDVAIPQDLPRLELDASSMQRANDELATKAHAAADAIKRGATEGGTSLGNNANSAMQGQAAAIGAAIGAAAAQTFNQRAKAHVNLSGAAGRKARRNKTQGAALADGVDDE